MMANGSRITNLGSFQFALGQEAKAIDDAIGLITRKIALDVLSRVVLATPIDTGRARGNWQVEVGGSGQVAELPNTDKGGGATIAAGSTEIDKLKTDPYNTVNIANALPYVEALNAGSSTQAPAGFIEAAVDAATRF